MDPNMRYVLKLRNSLLVDKQTENTRLEDRLEAPSRRSYMYILIFSTTQLIHSMIAVLRLSPGAWSQSS